jgi:hypothetical protein
MKLLTCLISVLALSLLTSCSRKPQLAASAVPKDFEGRWIGNWSWNSGNTTFLHITGTHVTVSNFATMMWSDDEMPVVGTEGVAEFQDEWDKRVPCVLLLFSEPKIGVTVYVTKDKSNLIYIVSESRNHRIEFTRLTPASNR